MDMQQLREKAREFVAAVEAEGEDELHVKEGVHYEIDEGVVFLCNLKSFFEGRGESAVGINPVLVSIETGNCRFLTLDESLSLPDEGRLVLE
ncbi:hypothetical protein M2163_001099 [Streptomyces sp. SAI-135]|uniref:hypothetical protein n=1 Tax=unclassified Streptomyces TaxID=2593676 RepID=UPI002476627D|nr:MULTISPECIES: hypothetical protein [unclassified Streptomyces]MDH6521907.1 hypothetical protein [Streptomyces sp. SAI-090]MDH6573276.1 hypothetical protein [Streptomyces sp. SAI-117]MDH6613991.1 hypothetical protein [Streptomyces sp. SAI-135]